MTTGALTGRPKLLADTGELQNGIRDSHARAAIRYQGKVLGDTNRQSWKNQSEILHSHCFRFPKSVCSHPPSIWLSSGRGDAGSSFLCIPAQGLADQQQAGSSCKGRGTAWQGLERKHSADCSRQMDTSEQQRNENKVGEGQPHLRGFGWMVRQQQKGQGSCHRNGDAPARPGRAKGRQRWRRGRQHPQPGWGREEEQAQRRSWERGRRNNKAGRDVRAPGLGQAVLKAETQTVREASG